MIIKKAQIKNVIGMPLENVDKLIKMAVGYEANIEFQHKGELYNAKSVLSILGAGLKHRDNIEFRFSGSDETIASDNIIRLVEKDLC